MPKDTTLKQNMFIDILFYIDSNRVHASFNHVRQISDLLFNATFK